MIVLRLGEESNSLVQPFLTTRFMIHESKLFSNGWRRWGRLIFGLLDKSSGLGQIFEFWTISLGSWTIFFFFFNISLGLFYDVFREKILQGFDCFLRTFQTINTNFKNTFWFLRNFYTPHKFESFDFNFVQNPRTCLRIQRFCPKPLDFVQCTSVCPKPEDFVPVPED